MKKKLLALGLTIGLILSMAGCDDMRTVRHIIIKTPTGEIIEATTTNGGLVTSSGTVRITIDGVEYITHVSNVLIMKEEE